MPGKVRKLILQLLEGCGNIEEDMKRYEEKWKRVGERIHPRKYPEYKKVNAAFSKLRNGEHIDTYAGKIDAYFKNGELAEAFNLLKQRPGELARKLDQLLRMAESSEIKNFQNEVCTEFRRIAPTVSIPVLLQLSEHFKYRNCDASRTFFPKGEITKGYTIKNNLPQIPAIYCGYITGACMYGITEQLKQRSSLGKVYVSESILGYAVPQSQRSASSEIKAITRGSRFNFDSNYIRFFIHWKNALRNGMEARVDIDLSCSLLREDYSQVDSVSFRQLKKEFACHSGDYTNAPRPDGACEFIDLDIQKAKDMGARYAVVQIYSYSSDPFADCETFFGFMAREDINSGEVFEPATVQNKMNIVNKGIVNIPVIIDLENKEYIWADLGLNTAPFFSNCVESNVKGVGLSVKGMVEAHKPQMYTLALMNARARGTIAKDRNDADVIFDIDTTKPTEKVIVESYSESGELIERKEIIREKENVRIITPYDLDVFIGDLM
jgi:hypothetical protein